MSFTRMGEIQESNGRFAAVAWALREEAYSLFSNQEDGVIKVAVTP